MKLDGILEEGKRKLEELEAKARYDSQPVELKCEKHGTYEIPRKYINEYRTNCPNCKQEEEKRRDRVRRIGDLKLKIKRFRRDLPRRYCRSTMLSYIPKNESQENAKTKILSYVKNLKDNLKNGRNMIFLGECGTGKTHLAHAFSHQCLKKNIYTKYITFSDLYEIQKGLYSGVRLESELRSYCNFEHFLIVDEIGVQHWTDGEKQFTFNLVNKRYNDMLPTIIISNLNINGLVDCMGERVVDRLKENNSLLINITGKSNRS